MPAAGRTARSGRDLCPPPVPQPLRLRLRALGPDNPPPPAVSGPRNPRPVNGLRPRFPFAGPPTYAAPKARKRQPHSGLASSPGRRPLHPGRVSPPPSPAEFPRRDHHPRGPAHPSPSATPVCPPYPGPGALPTAPGPGPLGLRDHAIAAGVERGERSAGAARLSVNERWWHRPGTPAGAPRSTPTRPARTRDPRPASQGCPCRPPAAPRRPPSARRAGQVR